MTLALTLSGTKKSFFRFTWPNDWAIKITIVDLLLISDDIDTKHYCWIKNFNRLMAMRTETNHSSMHYCKRCLLGYRKVDALRKHTEYCSQNNAQRIELPTPGSVISFSKLSRSMRIHLVVFVDFESFIKPMDMCQLDFRVSYTNKYQKHTPSSFCYYIKCFDDSLCLHEPTMFTTEDEADDVAQIFIDSLEE